MMYNPMRTAKILMGEKCKALKKSLIRFID